MGVRVNFIVGVIFFLRDTCPGGQLSLARIFYLPGEISRGKCPVGHVLWDCPESLCAPK